MNYNRTGSLQGLCHLDLSLRRVKGDKADWEISEVVVSQEGSPVRSTVSYGAPLFLSTEGTSMWPGPSPRVGQVVSLQFSRRHGGGQRPSLEGEAGGRGQGWSEQLQRGQGAEGWMGTNGGRSDGRTLQLTSVSPNSSVASCLTSSSSSSKQYDPLTLNPVIICWRKSHFCVSVIGWFCEE